jgi:hypothetical protein
VISVADDRLVAGPEDEETEPLQETPISERALPGPWLGPEDEETETEERGGDPRHGTKAWAGPEEEETEEEMAGENGPPVRT